MLIIQIVISVIVFFACISAVVESITKSQSKYEYQRRKTLR